MNYETTSRVAEFISVSKSGREVHAALSGIARKYGLTYNPNVSVDGVRGSIDPHGLVVGNEYGLNLTGFVDSYHYNLGLTLLFWSKLSMLN